MQHRLPLNNLNSFAHAAEHLSFQKAAEALFVTPSAVSHQIRNLEKILGYKLFDRSDKTVKLTLQGEKLFADIRAPIKQLQEAGTKAKRGLKDHSLALSVAPIFATGWLLPRLKDFYSSHPEINLTVIATTALVDFESDPFDASIRMGKGSWDKTSTIRLFNKEIVAVCHPKFLRSNPGVFTPSQLTKHPVIQNSAMPGLWKEWCDSAGTDAPDEQNIKFQAQGSSQVVEALQSGESVGLIDRNFIQNDIESGRLAIACKHVLYGNDGYFLTIPESTEAPASLIRFKEWLFKQLPKATSKDA